MSPGANQILESIRALPTEERVELATAILETVEDEYVSPPLSPEWQAEIKRRLAEIERGEAVFVSHEEVERQLEERYGPLED
jgi:putative addiction module component (TIGR02574 family)